jgi:hypothetical protein
MNDLRSIWKNQSKENTTMSAEELRIKVERYYVRARREGIAALVMAAGILTFGAAVLIAQGMRGPGPVVVTMLVITIAGVGRHVYMTYRVSDRIWPFPKRIVSTEALSATCLEFYRSGLDRQCRAYDARSWDLGILLGIFLTVFVPLYLRHSLSLSPVVLIAVFIILAFNARWRESRRVRRELEAVNEFQKQGDY